MPPTRQVETDPPPGDDLRVVAVGTALWGLALLALLPFVGRLRAEDRLWWLTACACGVLLGLVGVRTCRRRARADRR